MILQVHLRNKTKQFITEQYRHESQVVKPRIAYHGKFSLCLLKYILLEALFKNVVIQNYIEKDLLLLFCIFLGFPITFQPAQTFIRVTTLNAGKTTATDKNILKVILLFVTYSCCLQCQYQYVHETKLQCFLSKANTKKN